jgi:hypothetical protein
MPKSSQPSPPLKPEQIRAIAELELRRRARLGDGLLEFIPRVTPKFRAPTHLAKLAQLIERAARGETVRVLLSIPPQHGKTETIKHALVYAAERMPGKRHAYATYSDKRAWRIGKATRIIAESAGLEVKGTQDAWILPEGGQVRWVGIGGGLTGDPIDGLAIVDDPYKDVAQAQSATYRETVDEWFRGVLLARCNPGHSVIVIHTRWHPSDLIGTLAKEEGWEVINLPAWTEDEDGEQHALWPEERPIEFLRQKRADFSTFLWEALYMGRPRPRGMTVFSDVSTYNPAELRKVQGLRYYIGIDLAYTAKSSADYSVAVILAELPRKLPTDRRMFAVVNVIRRQERAPEFERVLHQLRAVYPRAPACSFVAGPEKGTIDFMNQLNKLAIWPVPASTDKFLRAQPAAALWNEIEKDENGHHKPAQILVPDSSLDDCPDWVSDFVEEVCSFTGVGDTHDDQVDALAGAVYAAYSPVTRRTHNVGAFVG